MTKLYVYITVRGFTYSGNSYQEYVDAGGPMTQKSCKTVVIKAEELSEPLRMELINLCAERAMTELGLDPREVEVNELVV